MPNWIYCSCTKKLISMKCNALLNFTLFFSYSISWVSLSLVFQFRKSSSDVPLYEQVHLVGGGTWLGAAGQLMGSAAQAFATKQRP